MVNEKTQQEQPAPSPWRMAAAGFELTTRHWWILLIPIVLDSFFWLGPRLGIEQVVAESAAILRQDPVLAEGFAGLIEQMELSAPYVNVYTGLSIPIIGVPALMNGPIPETTPLDPAVIQLSSNGRWLATFLLFSLLGLLLSTLYLGAISQLVKTRAAEEEDDDEAGPDWSRWLEQVPGYWLRLLLLGLVFLLLIFVLLIPLTPLAMVLGLINGNLGFLAIFLGLMTVIVYLSFAPHGILLNGRGLLPAIRESARLVQHNVWPTISLFLLLVIATGISDMLWRAADDGSWFTLVSIIGHSFVNTALIAATFVYYENRWQAGLDKTANNEQ